MQCLLHLCTLLAVTAVACALQGAASGTDAAQGRTAAAAQLRTGSAKPSTAAADTYMIAYHAVHAGAELEGHEAFIRSAGGKVVAVHPEIAVIVAKSRSSSFSRDVKRADSRIQVCIKPLITSCPPWSGPSACML